MIRKFIWYIIKKTLNSSLINKSLAFFSVGLLITFSAFGQTLPTAMEIASEMTIGLNIGNTLEAICGENAWGNPNVTQSLINAVKNARFNTVRLPVAWDCHSTSNVIDAAWLARVKEVVDYCMNANMYVIINIHWDNGWLENNVTTSAQSSVNVKQEAYWTQIANYFKDYDKHLLFASANEPNVEDATQMAVLMSYHQTFIDAVRTTGGNNSSRVLVIQGPSTDIEKTNQLMTSLPTDQIADHLIVEIHYYTPYQFCLMTEDAGWGNMFYYWGNGYHSSVEPDRNATWGEESDVENYFQLMKTQFVDKGIPVIMGEYCAIKRTNPQELSLHLDSRKYWYKYVTNAMVSYGLIPITWDTGDLFDRNTGAIKDQDAYDALMEGAGVTGTVIRPEAKKISLGFYRLSSSLIRNSYTGAINLAIANPDHVKNVMIFDSFGRKVQSLNYSAIQKSMQIGQKLQAGMYIVRIHDINGLQYFKAVKCQ